MIVFSLLDFLYIDYIDNILNSFNTKFRETKTFLKYFSNILMT